MLWALTIIVLVGLTLALSVQGRLKAQKARTKLEKSRAKYLEKYRHYDQPEL